MVARSVKARQVNRQINRYISLEINHVAIPVRIPVTTENHRVTSPRPPQMNRILIHIVLHRIDSEASAELDVDNRDYRNHKAYRSKARRHLIVPPEVHDEVEVRGDIHVREACMQIIPLVDKIFKIVKW